MNFTNTIDSWTTVIMVLLGAYCIYQFFILRKSEKLPEKSSLVLPPNESTTQCKDPKGYMQAIAPKILILGCSILFFGIAQGVCQYLNFTYQWLMITLFVLPLLVLVWYIFSYKKLLSQYWNLSKK